jgi:hypothetical protein
MEKHKVLELVELLIENKTTEGKIIEILSSIIQQQAMYGGNLLDKIEFQLDKAKKKA